MAEHSDGGADGAGNVIASLLAKVGISVDDSGLDRLHHNLERVKHAVELLAGIRILESIHSLGEKFASTGEALESAAIQTGLTTSELQELQYASSQNAVGADELTGALGRLGRQMFQAQKGSKGAVDTFARLGISQEQLAGFKSTKDALLAVQDGIGNLGSQQEKLAAVQQLFGRGGAKFLKFLSIGSEGTKELAKRAEQVGAVISETSIKSLAEFEDATSSFRQVSRSFLANFAGAFIGPITRGLRTLEEYFGKNKKYIVEGIAAIANEFGYYTYIAMGYVRVFGELIRRSLYGGDGLGGVVNQFLTFAKDKIVSTVRSVSDALQRAADNGSIRQLLDAFSSLLQHTQEAGSAAVETLSQFFGMLGGVDTSGLDASNRALVIFLTTLQTIVDVMDLAFKSFIYFAKGQFGSDLYDVVSGMATDISDSQNRLRRGNNAVLGLGGAAVAQGMQSVSAMSAAAPTYATTVMASPQRSAGSGVPVSVVANVTVNAMSPSDAGDIAEKTKQRVSEALAQAMNEARRDLSHPVLW